MRAVDTNILVSARPSEAPHHLAALRVLNSLATGSEPVGPPLAVRLRVPAGRDSPPVFDPPTPLAAAWEAVELLLDSPSIVALAEAERHGEILAELLRVSPVTGNLVHDAHIAALLIEHAVDEIVTADEDFRRFPRLKVVNPFRP